MVLKTLHQQKEANYRGISKLPIHTNCRTVLMNGAAFLNLQTMAPANMEEPNKSVTMVIDGKMFLVQAAAPFGIIQPDNLIFPMLTFMTITKTIFKIVLVYQYCLILFGSFPTFKL